MADRRPLVTVLGDLKELPAGDNLHLLDGVLLDGAYPRIFGPMGGGGQAHIQRLLFQNSTADAQTRVGVIPNGTAVQAGFMAYNAADPDNAASGTLFVNNTGVYLHSAFSGTGVLQPIYLSMNGVNALGVGTDGVVSVSAFKFTTSPSAGAVLTSDANGNASWQAPGAVTYTDYPESSPAAPAAGYVRLFGKKIGGRMMPAFIGPSGLSSTLQPHMARNGWAMWTPSFNSTTISAIGAAALTANGTATAANYATTSLHTRCRRVDYLVTTAATTAVAGYRYATATYRTLEGFHHVCRFCPATGVTGLATRRAWVGMYSATTASTDVNPSVLTNFVGVGYDSADTNWQVMTNDATGAATKVDTGIARPSTDRQSVYAVNIFAAPGGASIGVQFLDEGTGQEFNTTLTTDLPVSTTALAPRGYASVGGTSSVVGLTLFGLYMETDN